MDTRAMRFVVLLVFTGVITLVKVDSTDNSTVLSNNTSTTSTKPDVTSNKPIDKTNTRATGMTEKSTSPTTSAPLDCKSGECNGTGIDDCLNVPAKSCKSGESCAVVQTKLNHTYSSFSFSCAADCLALVKEERSVACCSISKCKPDLSKPIDNNGGVTAVPFNFIPFLTLLLTSVLVM